MHHCFPPTEGLLGYLRITFMGACSLRRRLQPTDRRMEDCKGDIRVLEIPQFWQFLPADLRIDISAPTPQAPSMTMAIEHYIQGK